MLLTEQAQCNGWPCIVQDSTNGNPTINIQEARAVAANVRSTYCMMVLAAPVQFARVLRRVKTADCHQAI
jgi:hypothetical protein